MLNESEIGIPCLIKSSMGSTFSTLAPVDQAMKGFKVYVPESALEKAIEIAETIIPDYKRPDENS